MPSAIPEVARGEDSPQSPPPAAFTAKMLALIMVSSSYNVFSLTTQFSNIIGWHHSLPSPFTVEQAPEGTCADCEGLCNPDHHNAEEMTSTEGCSLSFDPEGLVE